MQGKKMKILIVDDSDMNREILSDMLSEDYEIAEAVNGKQALALLENAPDAFSLMLLDIVMPDMDGFELMAILSRHRRTESLPVIIISSETAPTSIKRAFEFGATDYISRPFDAE
jgi:putative two-component system response regulator